jgi:hypothetical protein
MSGKKPKVLTTSVSVASGPTDIPDLSDRELRLTQGGCFWDTVTQTAEGYVANTAHPSYPTHVAANIEVHKRDIAKVSFSVRCVGSELIKRGDSSKNP